VASHARPEREARSRRPRVVLYSGLDDQVEPVDYFTNASNKGRVRYRHLADSIGVMESPDNPMPVGMVSAIDRTEDRVAVWSLRVHGADVPGRRVIVDRKFVAPKLTLRYSIRGWTILVAHAVAFTSLAKFIYVFCDTDGAGPW
jgi:hypothetical protein